jgi:hypothetical protein
MKRNEVKYFQPECFQKNKITKINITKVLVLQVSERA